MPGISHLRWHLLCVCASRYRLSCQKYYSLGRHSGSLLGRQHLSDATGMATSR